LKGFGRLPELEEELEKLLERTTHDLSRLPSPPSSEPVGEMLRLIGSFARSVEYLVEGTPDDDGLIQALREPRKSFKKAIRLTAPDFRPLARPKRTENVRFVNKQPSITLAPIFLKDEEEDWQDQTSSSDAIYIEDVMRRANS
jgi:hypothetical protein